MSENLEEVVLEFFRKSKEHKLETALFEDVKGQFYSEMESYFSKEGISSKTFDISQDTEVESLVVNRVQTSKVIFDTSKLRKALGELASSVISKKYKIADMNGLVAYLKECNVDPKIFKTFLVVEEVVNEDEIDRLFDIGKVKREQVAGCYHVKKNKPYFTVKPGKGTAKNGNKKRECKW